MKHKKVLLLLGILLVAAFLLFGTLKKSPVDDFPIPIIAQVDTKHSNKTIDYEYKGSNSIYVKHVQLFGWKEVERMGSMGIFEKDGKQVSLTTFEDGFSIATYSN